MAQAFSFVLLCAGDPKVTVCVKQDGACAAVMAKAENDFSFFGNQENLYARNSGSILKCSREFRENVKPLLSAGQNKFRFSLEDLPAFCSCVLPKIEDLVTMDTQADFCRNTARTTACPVTILIFCLTPDSWERSSFSMGRKSSEGDSVFRDERC
jgi:hypothetical protein